MARRRLLCLSLWTILTLPLPGLSQEGAPQEAPQARQLPAPRQLEVRRAASPIQVDGVLDEPAWADALVFDIPFEWFPGDNTPGPVKTDFLVTYDDDSLYAAWRAYDPDPASIRAHLADRDTLTTFAQDDHVVLMVDPFNDERRGFQFRINPLGVQADALFSQNEQLEDFSYDMIWDSAARITDEGYVVEVAIPLDQIRFPRTPGPQTWGFNVDRSYPRNVRHRMSASPIPRGLACVLCQAVKVTGFEDIEPGRNLEITPTLTAGRTDVIDRFPDGDLEAGDEETDPGVSLRWGITPNITLSAAANPD
ncbi:MAG TPA: carbohydrate binding family 9 domain-containing protein, partial [Thermoanaerobaculia bacterium]|nr:carbohydrate binding family 9 domain-containing protein [Thermoanaerobaculia bacterium]